MGKSEVKEIIRQLKKKEIKVSDVPKEYENDIQIVTFEREFGLRITGKRGFDIISNSFFVEEKLIYADINGKERILKSVFLSFDNFDSYFDFLNGNIYDNACYTYCLLSKDTIASRKIDVKKLMERKAFIEDTIDNYSLSVSNEEKDCYKNSEQIHRECQQWVKKFNNCSSYDELVEVVNNYSKSEIAPVVDVIFFFFNYIFADIEDKQRFSIIMEYMSSGAYPQYKIINALCSIYNPDDVIQSFNYSLGSRGTIYKYKRKLKEYICHLKNGEIEFYSKAFFDKKTHYYCEKVQGYVKGNKNPVSTVYRYFESFEEFAVYRNGNLTDCDLSAALECDEDFSKYIVDETTKLPIHTDMEVTYSVKKYYDNGEFHVTQQWCNTFGSVTKEYSHCFRYFFDFVAFLKGDLSGANLIFCDGLVFLEQWDSINFTNAKMTSALYEKFGLGYDGYKIKKNLIESFECVEQNENETALLLQTSRDLTDEAAKRDLSALNIAVGYKCQKVHYISDIHLMHRIQNVKCRSKEDVIYVIKKIVDAIANEAGSLLLIDGDVASDFDIFQLFVKMLSKTLRQNTMVIFILGNHELWSFPDLLIDKIVLKYRTFLDEYGMYLLHNDILYKENCSLLNNSNIGTHLIKYDELCEMDDA